jgi:hypothetical protein
VPLFAEQKQVCRIDVQAAAVPLRTLRPLEQPEAEPEGETVCEREAAQFVGAGDLEDLAVLDIGRVGGAARQRVVHDGSFERVVGVGPDAPRVDCGSSGGGCGRMRRIGSAECGAEGGGISMKLRAQIRGWGADERSRDGPLPVRILGVRLYESALMRTPAVTENAERGARCAGAARRVACAVS